MAIMNKIYWISLSLIGIFLTSSIIPVLADDGSGCKDYKTTDMSFNRDWNIWCYVEGLYHQNQILIQEQNQTNKLIAYQTCTSYGSGEYSQNSKSFNYYENVNSCVNELLNKTK